MMLITQYLDVLKDFAASGKGSKQASDLERSL